MSLASSTSAALLFSRSLSTVRLTQTGGPQPSTRMEEQAMAGRADARDISAAFHRAHDTLENLSRHLVEDAVTNNVGGVPNIGPRAPACGQRRREEVQANEPVDVARDSMHDEGRGATRRAGTTEDRISSIPWSATRAERAACLRNADRPLLAPFTYHTPRGKPLRHGRS